MNIKKVGFLIILTAIAMPAHSQSSVTLYGIVDVAVEYISHVPASGEGGGGAAFSVISGGAQTSRWGLRVIEDLGGGYGAVAVLEDGFDASRGTFNNAGRLWGRSSYVGLKSPFGSLTLGRQVTGVYDFALTFDPVTPALYSSPMYDLAFAGRADNSAKYAAKLDALGGQLALSALYSFGYDSVSGAGPVAGDYHVGKEESVFVTYQRSLATVGLLFDQQDGNTIDAQNNKIQRYGVGAIVDLKPVQIYAAYRLFAEKQLGQNLYSSLYWVALRYQVTPAFGVSSDIFYQEDRNTGQGSPATLSVLASYSLSKRTDIYGEAGAVLNKKRSTLGFNGFGTAMPGSLQTGAMLGLRTHF